MNFSEAAKAMYVTQSTLSQQIRQLEDEIGILLFERSSHNVILTEAGQEMLPYAIEAIHSAASCVDRINDLKQMLTGTLRIGVTYTFIPILTETVDEFMKCYPAVKMDICCKPMEELMQMLEEDEELMNEFEAAYFNAMTALLEIPAVSEMMIGETSSSVE